PRRHQPRGGGRPERDPVAARSVRYSRLVATPEETHADPRAGPHHAAGGAARRGGRDPRALEPGARAEEPRAREGNLSRRGAGPRAAARAPGGGGGGARAV